MQSYELISRTENKRRYSVLPLFCLLLYKNLKTLRFQLSKMGFYLTASFHHSSIWSALTLFLAIIKREIFFLTLHGLFSGFLKIRILSWRDNNTLLSAGNKKIDFVMKPDFSLEIAETAWRFKRDNCKSQELLFDTLYWRSPYTCTYKGTSFSAWSMYSMYTAILIVFVRFFCDIKFFKSPPFSNILYKIWSLQFESGTHKHILIFSVQFYIFTSISRETAEYKHVVYVARVFFSFSSNFPFFHILKQYFYTYPSTNTAAFRFIHRFQDIHFLLLSKIFYLWRSRFKAYCMQLSFIGSQKHLID